MRRKQLKQLRNPFNALGVISEMLWAARAVGPSDTVELGALIYARHALGLGYVKKPVFYTAPVTLLLREAMVEMTIWSKTGSLRFTEEHALNVATRLARFGYLPPAVFWRFRDKNPDDPRVAAFTALVAADRIDKAYTYAEEAMRRA